MTRLSTTTVSLAVTPTVISTFFSHYLNRGPLHQKPTAHLSYDEGLNLIRAFLEFASHHTVEELQAFTSQWVPHPQWVKVKDATIPDPVTSRAADLLLAQLGEDGVQKLGGPTWWQWRKPDTPLRAEWIEMRADYQERKKRPEAGNRVMLYVHGGAFFFGSVDEHRYQMQRHARKLKARVFAPEYRLAPQFPFPCGLQDCLAAYLFLLDEVSPSAIVLAGDSAGAGMVVSMLVMLRDQGVPMPAGAVLISPWVDLTHSFPSVAGENPLDYIPPGGFHHKPSMAWPPPSDEEMGAIRQKAKEIRRKLEDAHMVLMEPQSREAAIDSVPLEETAGSEESHRRQSEAVARMLSVEIDGKLVKLMDQIQMYTTNELLSHPLVSPILQPTLGGLPPVLVMVGGAELLRDEQICLAHKFANPAKYAPPALSDEARTQLGRFKPTPVQLQVWDDLCHVAPTLSFTRPAKYMYRSVAQFSAWALARAQHTAIVIPDDNASVISLSNSEDDARNQDPGHVVGKAGHPLPPFKDHMIRQRVTRHGTIFPLDIEASLPGCSQRAQDVGIVKAAPVRRWLETRRRWDARYAKDKAKVHDRMAHEMAEGYLAFGNGETPPASALAGRRRSPAAKEGWGRRKRKGMGLSLWSLWGSAHDKVSVAKELAGGGAEVSPDAEERPGTGRPRGMSYRGVTDENQTGEGTSLSGTTNALGKETSVLTGTTEGKEASVVSERRGTLVEDLLRERREKEEEHNRLLGPGHAVTGVAGRRPMVEGVAVPFSLGGGTATSSMVTLNSEGASAVGSRATGSAEGEGASRTTGGTGGTEALAGAGEGGKRDGSVKGETGSRGAKEAEASLVGASEGEKGEEANGKAETGSGGLKAAEAAA